MKRQCVVRRATNIVARMTDRRHRFCFYVAVCLALGPETLIRWHRAGFRLLWRWKSRPGRPRIPLELRELIRRMARENPLWGQERIANELLLKLGLRVSPRTVRKYLPRPVPGRPRGDQRWSTFLRNHVQAIVAYDFFVVVTSTFRVLYVLIVIEHYSRRLIHCGVTAHPSAQWARQRLRDAVGWECRYEYLIHDRDCIFSAELDESVRRLGLRVLKSWIDHYNHSRPHMALGPGVPDPPPNLVVPLSESPHGLGGFGSIRGKSVLGGLHHEYSFACA